MPHENYIQWMIILHWYRVDINSFIIAHWQQLVSCFIELDTPNLITVLLEYVDTLLSAHLPNLNSSIAAAGYKMFIVRTEVYWDDPGGVTWHGPQQCGVADVVQFNVTVIRLRQ